LSFATSCAFLNQGPFALPALPGFFAHTDPSATPKAQPVPRGIPVGRSRSGHLLGFPVLPRSPCARMLPPIPRWNRRVLVSLSSPSIAAFPVSKAGRLPHQHVQGLLSVHCTLQPAGSRGHLRDPFHRRLQPLRYLHDCSDCCRRAKVARWVCLLLGDRAFPRRTSRLARRYFALRACTLALLPIRDTHPEGFSYFVAFHSCAGCFRLERLPGGTSPTGKRHRTTAHTHCSHRRPFLL
jgi:hypothetical protein